jgi:hypothetical protein
MPPRKKAKEEEETAIVRSDIDDLMSPIQAPAFDPGDAGLGSEDVGGGDVVLPRLSLLQVNSRVMDDELPGAKPGAYWTVPHNRPASFDSKGTVRFVVVRIYPAQRLWTPIDEGGGIICEAAGGDLVARDPQGLAGADIAVEHDGSEVTSVGWTGGEPTNMCEECVYGPAAAAAVAGRKPSGKGNPWLPKFITFEGTRLRVPDKIRAPRCTSSLDVLALVALPPFQDDESGIDLAQDIIPAFITFGRSAQPAGRSLAGMIKLAVREPAWAKIFTAGAKKVSNDKGTFFIPTIGQFGYANERLMAMARELYDSTKTQDFRPSMDDGGDTGAEGATDHDDVSDQRPLKDDEPAPEDKF